MSRRMEPYPSNSVSCCVKYAYKEEGAVPQVGTKLICQFIGRNSEAREHRRKSGQRRRPERRKGRRDKKKQDVHLQVCWWYISFLPREKSLTVYYLFSFLNYKPRTRKGLFCDGDFRTLRCHSGLFFFALSLAWITISHLVILCPKGNLDILEK